MWNRTASSAWKKHPQQDGATDAGEQAAKDAAGFQPQRRQAPWHLDFSLFSNQQKQKAKRQFMVTRLEDPKLIPDLQAHGVDYRGKIESHWLSHFLSNWILPLVIFVLLGRFLVRRMGKGAGFLDVGKSKARIYAVDPSQKVTFEPDIFSCWTSSIIKASVTADNRLRTDATS